MRTGGIGSWNSRRRGKMTKAEDVQGGKWLQRCSTSAAPSGVMYQACVVSVQNRLALAVGPAAEWAAQAVQGRAALHWSVQYCGACRSST